MYPNNYLALKVGLRYEKHDLSTVHFLNLTEVTPSININYEQQIQTLVTPGSVRLPDRHQLHPLPSLGFLVLLCTLMAFLESANTF